MNVCRLSHHAASTLYLIDEPYIRSESAVTYERGSCYNVTIECQVLKASIYINKRNILFKVVVASIFR